MAFDSGPVDQSVRIKRVRRFLDAFEIDAQTCFLGMLHQRRIRFDRTFLAAKLALEIRATIHAFFRHFRIQLERVPRDQKGMVGALRQRAVEMRFANVAPRANRVGHDVELDHEVFLSRRWDRSSRLCRDW